MQANKSVRTLAVNVETIKKHIAEQVESVKNISSSITEMSTNINNVAMTAKDAQDTSLQLSATSTESVVDAVQAIQTLTNKENEIAENMQKFMNSVVEASKSTLNAILQGLHTGAQNYTAHSITQCSVLRRAISAAPPYCRCTPDTSRSIKADRPQNQREQSSCRSHPAFLPCPEKRNYPTTRK